MNEISLSVALDLTIHLSGRKNSLFAAAAREDVAQPALFDDAVSGGDDERRVAAIQNAVQLSVPAEAEYEQYDEKPQAGIVAESSETVH